ncbi:MAG: hypothetical protein IKF83_00010 [Clostridia bacterium]|nr:hypothetical protein [Clostridia bacterium]
MKISKELKEEIEKYISNKGLVNRLLSLNPKAIAYLGQISQSGIKPKEVIEAYNNNDMDAIYKLANKKIKLEEIYNELILIYSEKIASEKDKGER